MNSNFFFYNKEPTLYHQSYTVRPIRLPHHIILIPRATNYHLSVVTMMASLQLTLQTILVGLIATMPQPLHVQLQTYQHLLQSTTHLLTL